MDIAIVNGPNLNLLGKREPEIYGSKDFESFFKNLKEKYSKHNLTFFQSNIEGEIIDHLQEKGFNADGIILNPGAYTHTSIAIADCVAAINSPVIEVHISNIYKREPFRHHSYSAPNSIGVITGLGLAGYELALNYLLQNTSK